MKRVVVLMLAAAAFGPPPALAGTGSVSSGTVFYTAAAGETNNVQVDLDIVGTLTYYVSDSGVAVTPGAGCTAVNANKVRCSTGSYMSVEVFLSDRNDRLDFDCWVGAFGGPGTAHGGDGDDVIFGTLGSDRLEGDGGADTLRGRPSSTLGGCNPNSPDGDDTLVGGFGADTLYGSAGTNVLDGGPDDDVLTGSFYFGAAETLRGGEGNDTLTDDRNRGNTDFSGGPGNDSITSVSSCVNCSIFDHSVVESADTNFVLTDTSLTGLGTDTLSGLNAARLEGGLGENTLDASAFSGRATLSGGWSSDTLKGGSGDDRLSGGAYGDDFSGGGGSDTVDYTTHPDSGVTVTFDDVANDGTATTDWTPSADPGDNVRSDVENAIGTNGPDRFTGTESANRFEGRGGVDTLAGGFGDDVLIGGPKGDDLSGGGGSDTVDYSGHDSGVTVTPDNVANDGALTTDWDGDGTNRRMDNVRSDVENIYGSNGADDITGTASANRLDGRGGNDTFDSGPGNDSFWGGDGDDVFTSGPGSDYFDGEDGLSNSFVEVADADMTFVNGILDVGADHNRMDSVSGGALVGGPGNNTLDASGSTSAFLGLSIDGGAGHDIVKGGSGYDFLYGGAGDDIVSGGDGGDVLVGGAGNDSLTGGGGFFSDEVIESGDVDFTLTGSSLTGLGTDTIATVERVRLTGGPGDNTLDAGGFSAGSVTLNGLGGDDVLTGGAYSDSLNGGDGVDRVTASANVDFTLTDGSLTGDGLSSIEQATLTGGPDENLLDASAFTGAVILDGAGGADTMRGGGADDVLTGGTGADTLDGNGGIDTVQEAADANLVLSNSSLAGNGTDSLSEIERADLTGGGGNNTLDASAFSGSAALDGAGGNDSLTGGAGNDSLTGGAGSDAFAGGSGNDAIAGRDQVAGEQVGCGGGGADSAVVDSDDVVNQDCEQVDYGPATLTVTKTGTGAGRVASRPMGIDCGKDCGEEFVFATEVTLTATAESNSTFTGWSGVCTGTDECVVIMSGAKNVTATFALNRYTLRVGQAGTGFGTVADNLGQISCGDDCSGDYDAATAVTLTASPSTDSSFDGWSGACTGAGPCSVTMSEARSVTATFTLLPVSPPPPPPPPPAAPPPPPASPPPPPPSPPAPQPQPQPRPGAQARCVVPNVKGKTLAQARRALAARKCALGRVRTANSAKVKKGRIVSQSRRPGARFTRGARVNVVVSRGPAQRS